MGESQTRDIIPMHLDIHHIVFDQCGQIPDSSPRWEEYAPLLTQEAELEQEREILLDYQQQLDEAREALVEGEITEAELEELQARLIENIPKAVRERLPDDHPAAQVEATVQAVATPSISPTSGPSLDGLESFAPAMPTPGS